MSQELLIASVRNLRAMSDLFKKQVFQPEFYSGEWVKDGKMFRLTLPDGSKIRLKFFNTVKTIQNSKLQDIPGRESFLSYIDVAVMPAGEKAYSFNIDIKLHPWGHSRSSAMSAHAESIQNLISKAKILGIELTPADFETFYVGKM